ncbi:uncharacterized protein Dwil_GK14553 [Drosophila willistoni]|uniref:Uncharacterized protein n=1 Tax=Drosophila willistoni TaxID=7260 RepID=B4NPT4_DROWI|nr:uncharacterized protein LOC6652800 [Drosophila willistoni]EDW86524.1 uncharacterized protein Dwil_GK14553 [Drosophila willistoni]
MSSEQQEQEESTPTIRRGPPMPSEDMMRNSIASNLTQILLNMRNANYQQQCREILQVDDLSQGAYSKILNILKYIDEKRPHPRTRET